MDVRRAVLQVPSPAWGEAGLRLDHLNGGQVRLQVTSSGGSVQGWFCATLEDVGLPAAIRGLDKELKDVVWEVPNP